MRCSVSRAFAAIGARLPKGWGDAGRQIAILVGVDVIYELGRGIADSNRADALTHGAQVIDLERATHTFFEPSLQSFFLPTHWVVDLANQLYLNAQFSIALGFLVWLYLFRNESYYFVRNMFVVSMCLALIGYIGYPTAPPRMFPAWGFVDTLAEYSGVNHSSTVIALTANPYAAMPSLHSMDAFIVAIVMFGVCRSLAARLLWVLWPAWVWFSVMGTGNHYWLDVVAGVIRAIVTGLTLFRRSVFARGRVVSRA